MLGRVYSRAAAHCSATVRPPTTLAGARPLSGTNVWLNAAHARFASDDDCVHSLQSIGQRVPHVNCWRCDKKGLDCVNERFFCEQCGALQPPVKCVNYFQYLDADVSFSLDVDDVKKRYRRIVAMLHPDKFAQSSHVEIDHSERQASVVNRAYKTITHPLERALYILQLHGVPFDEDTANTTVDPMFLMDMLELNEQVQDSSSSEELSKVKDDCLNEMARCEKALTNAFEKQQFEHATKIITRMKYYSRVIDNVDRKCGY